MKCSEKKFKIPADKILSLIKNAGACLATDKITVDGLPVGYMYRDESVNQLDNGWRFFSGTEDQNYVDDPENTCPYDTNTIANYDPAIIIYLDAPVGTKLERKDEFTFIVVE